MDLFKETSAWNNQLEPLLKKYQGKKHPLDYNNVYQLMVMVKIVKATLKQRLLSSLMVR